jgi:hypothetical protein
MNALRIFDRKMVRKIYVPLKEKRAGGKNK